MSKVKCSGCGGEYDSEDMIIQDEETVYCLSCDYVNSVNLDNLTGKDDE